MPKWVKTALAVLLLPLCLGATESLVRVLQAAGGARTVWVPLLGGAACWVVVYVSLPRPMWLYVVGHELTHVVWAWAFGGRVKRLRVTSKGGFVELSRTNFLITLAPYFFPFYVVLVVLVFLLGHWIWNWSGYLPWFHLCVGAAYAFHVTLTVQVLHTRQTDITKQGFLFSVVVIWLGNVGVLLVGLALLTDAVDLPTALGWAGTAAAKILVPLRGWGP